MTKKTLLRDWLRLLASALLAKYRPEIVAITGSVGKSATKEAVALALASRQSVRKSEGNYNNEYGIPLTILGEKSPGSSLFGWFLLSLRFLATYFFARNYPRILVLELGIDRPGDMDYLVSFLPLTVGVATHVSESHMKHFGSLQVIAREKGKLIEALPPAGTAVLNADDERVRAMGERTRARVITYGFDRDADLSADHLVFHGKDGYSLKINYQGKSLPLRLPHIIARHHIPAVLAAAAVAVGFRMNLVDIMAALQDFRPLPGRLNLLSGTHKTLLLDDTYNASPASTRAALAVLGDMNAPRKIAVLGDMLELGPESDALHAALGENIKDANVNLVFLVGKHMRALHTVLFEKGFGRKQLYLFDDPQEAVEALVPLLRPGDLILVKGSQGVRMELISERLLDFSERAEEKLCRQNPSWKKLPFTPPAEWQSGQ